MRCITINSYTHTQTHTLHSGYINGRIDRGTIAKRHIRRNITRFFKDYLKQKYRCVVSLDSQRGTAASRCNWSWIKFLFPWILIIRFILFMSCPVSFWSELKEILPCILRLNCILLFSRTDSLNQPASWLTFNQMHVYTYLLTSTTNLMQTLPFASMWN